MRLKCLRGRLWRVCSCLPLFCWPALFLDCAASGRLLNRSTPPAEWFKQRSLLTWEVDRRHWIRYCRDIFCCAVADPRFRRWGAWLTGLLLVAFMLYIGYYYNVLRGAECSCFPWLKRAVGLWVFRLRWRDALDGDRSRLVVTTLGGQADRSHHSRRGDGVCIRIVWGDYARQTGGKLRIRSTVMGSRTLYSTASSSSISSS